MKLQQTQSLIPNTPICQYQAVEYTDAFRNEKMMMIIIITIGNN
jgi:hypothetical protein